MIGILCRFDYTPSGKESYIVYKSIVDIILKYNVNIIGIIPTNKNVKEIINTCDGIILTGGDNDILEDRDIIKYIYETDIPCLGICMGMQEMALLFNGKIDKIDNHYHTNHKVIAKDSIIYGSKVLSVNSRHHECIVKTDLDVTGMSSDNVIEMVEDKAKRFFIGVQWHPENMDDLDSKILFDKFIESTRNVN